MINPWKHIIEKLNAKNHAMQESDWAAMRAKIEAYPELRPRPRNSKAYYYLGSFILAGIIGITLIQNTENDFQVDSPGSNPSSNETISDNHSMLKKKPISSEELNINEANKKKKSQKRNSDKTTVGNAKSTNQSNNAFELKNQAKNAVNLKEKLPLTELSIALKQPTAINQNPGNSPALSAQYGNDENSRFLMLKNNRSSAVSQNIESTTAFDSSSTNAEIALPIDSLYYLGLKDQASEEEAPIPLLTPKPALNPYSLQIGTGISSQLNSHGWHQWQTGVDIYFTRNNLLLNAGIYTGERWIKRDDSYIQNTINLDSIWTRNIETRNELHISKVWVIDSFFAGHYEIDTSVVQVTDTIYQWRLDSTTVTTNIKRESRIVKSFVSIPLTVGYRFNFGRWDILGNGGTVFRRVTTSSREGAELQHRLEIDLLLRPELSYRFNSRWDFYTRLSLRAPIAQNSNERSKSIFYGGQIGIAYRFKR